MRGYPGMSRLMTESSAETAPAVEGRGAGFRRAVRAWPVWALPWPLRAYVVAIVAASVAATGLEAAHTPWRWHDALVCGVLLVIGLVSVESVRRMGEPALAA